MSPETIDQIAQDLVDAFGSPRMLLRLTEQYDDFSADDGYRVGQRIRDLRQARGETPIGRKIGGTNPKTYALSGATGPSWSFVYDSTCADLPGGVGSFALGGFRQPRIEPELVLHLGAPPRPGMSEAELLGCVDRVAHGYEFVHSPYADWKVAGPDASAAYGMHQALVVGPWHDITADRASWGDRLKSFTITLRSSTGVERHGTGANAYGSPILALGAMVADIAANADRTPLAAGEIVTTGTLTDLMPVAPGETWATTITGAPLEGLSVTLT